MRGTTRDPARAPEIAAAGAEPFVGDPDRIATLMPALEGVAVAVWLLGGVDDDSPVHGDRFEFFLGKVVDTMVRGVLYERPHDGGGGGQALLEGAAQTWEIPIRVVDHGVGDVWRARASTAVESLLGAGR